MRLRAGLLGCLECSFRTIVTADYGDSVQKFAMDCTGDSKGNLRFAVAEPETIAGITGKIEDGDGYLTFDDTVLSFPLLADGRVSPVSAPWILLKTLRSGYLTACCKEEDKLHITVDDSYADDALKLEIWLDESQTPVLAEVYHEGGRILTMTVEGFKIG